MKTKIYQFLAYIDVFREGNLEFDTHFCIHNSRLAMVDSLIDSYNFCACN